MMQCVSIQVIVNDGDDLRPLGAGQLGCLSSNLGRIQDIFISNPGMFFGAVSFLVDEIFQSGDPSSGDKDGLKSVNELLVCDLRRYVHITSSWRRRQQRFKVGFEEPVGTSLICFCTVKGPV